MRNLLLVLFSTVLKLTLIDSLSFNSAIKSDIGECTAVTDWAKSKLDHRTPTRIIKDALDNIYVLNVYRGKSNLCEKPQRHRRQALDAEKLFDKITAANVEVETLDSNITITELLNVSSGESIVDIQEDRLNARILCKTFNMQIDPKYQLYNMSVTDHTTQVNLTKNNELNLAADYSRIVVRAVNKVDEHLNVTIDSNNADISILSGQAKVEIFDASKSFITIDTLNTTIDERLIITSSVQNNVSLRRDLTIFLLTQNGTLVTRLQSGRLLITYTPVTIEISEDFRNIHINTGVYNINISTILAPYSITFTDFLRIEADKTDVTIYPSTSNVDLNSVDPYMIIMPDPESSVSLSTNDNKPPLDMTDARVEVQAKRVNMQIISAEERIIADSQQSNTYIDTEFTNVGIKSNKSRLEILDGAPWIRLFSHNISVEIRRGDFSDGNDTQPNITSSTTKSIATTSLPTSTTKPLISTTSTANPNPKSTSTKPSVSPNFPSSSPVSSASTSKSSATSRTSTTSRGQSTVILTSTFTISTPNNQSTTTDDFIIGQFSDEDNKSRSDQKTLRSRLLKPMRDAMRLSHDMVPLAPVSSMMHMLFKPVDIIDEDEKEVHVLELNNTIKLQNLRMIDANSSIVLPTNRPRRYLANQQDDIEVQHRNVTMKVPVDDVIRIVLVVPFNVDINSEQFRDDVVSRLLRAYLVARSHQLGANGNSKLVQTKRRVKRNVVQEELQCQIVFIGRPEREKVNVDYCLMSNGINIDAHRAVDTFSSVTSQQLSAILSYPVLKPPITLMDAVQNYEASRFTFDTIAVCVLAIILFLIFFIIAVIAYKIRERNLRLGKDWCETPGKIPGRSIKYRRNGSRNQIDRQLFDDTLNNKLSNIDVENNEKSTKENMQVEELNAEKILEYIKEDLKELETPRQFSKHITAMNVNEENAEKQAHKALDAAYIRAIGAHF